MLIIIHDEKAYLSWVARHQSGFVLDAQWTRSVKHPLLHRASCAEIKRSKSKRTHWTTGPHIKACSLNLTELLAWTKDQTGAEPPYCELCHPDRDSNDVAQATLENDGHLTRMARHVLETVIEAAVISLDHDASRYGLTVLDVALSLSKTPAQISPALAQLVVHGYLQASGKWTFGQPMSADCRLYPTLNAMRSLPAYAEMETSAVQAELDRLNPESSQ